MFLISCNSKNITQYDSKTFTKKYGILYHNNEPFNGTLEQVKHHNHTKIAQYKDGRRHGTQKTYTQNEKLIEIRRYKKGNCYGKQEAWWSKNQKKHLYYCNKHGMHGKYLSWFGDGSPSKEQNYKNGHEEGQQQAWFTNGKVKANYIIKSGRRYGLPGTKLCRPSRYRKKTS